MLWTLLLACHREQPPPAGSPPVLDGALHFDGPPPRNLIMLSVDTLRRDRVGRYDAGPSLTPFLDARMEEAVALDELSSCSNWTVAATTCVLAGATNLDRAEARGMVPILVDDPLAPIPADTPLLPFWLEQEGFASILVSANSYFSDLYGNAQ